MALRMEVGLGPGHIVLDGDRSPLQKRGQSPPIFGPFLLWSNGCMEQDATWYGGTPRPKRHSVRWGPSSPSLKGAQPPNFWRMSVVAKWLDGLRCPIATWYGGRPQPRRWGPSSPQKEGQNPPPNFWSTSIVAIYTPTPS